MSDKTSERLEAAHQLMLGWCAANGGEPQGYREAAEAEIRFWREVESHTSDAFAALMFGQWQDARVDASAPPPSEGERDAA